MDSFGNDFSLSTTFQHVNETKYKNKDWKTGGPQIENQDNIKIIDSSNKDMDFYLCLPKNKSKENNIKSKKCFEKSDNMLEEKTIFKTHSSIQEELSRSTISPCETFVNQSWKEKFNLLKKQENKSLLIEKRKPYLNITIDDLPLTQTHLNCEEKIGLEVPQIDKENSKTQEGSNCSVISEPKKGNTSSLFNLKNIKKKLINANKENMEQNSLSFDNKIKDNQNLRKKQNSLKPKREILGESKIHSNANLSFENIPSSNLSALILNSKKHNYEQSKKQRNGDMGSDNTNILYKNFKYFSDYQQRRKEENKKPFAHRRSDIEKYKGKENSGHIIKDSMTLLHDSPNFPVVSIDLMKNGNLELKGSVSYQHKALDEEQHFQSPCLISNQNSQRMESTMEILNETQEQNSVEEETIKDQKFISRNNKNLLERILKNENRNKVSNNLLFCGRQIPKERKVLIIGNKTNNTSVLDDNQDPSILSNFLEIEKGEQIYDFSSKLNESEFIYEPSKKENRECFYINKSYDDLNHLEKRLKKQSNSKTQNSMLESKEIHFQKPSKRRVKSEGRLQHLFFKNSVL